MLLSKKQFKSAVERLRLQFAPSHIFKMVSKALERAGSPLMPEEVLLLENIENRLASKPDILDRRRAEGYLSNAIYGQPYNKISHRMPADKDLPKTTAEWEDMSEHYRIYGILLFQLNPHYTNYNKPIRFLFSHIYEKLLSTPIANFRTLVNGDEEIMYDRIFNRFSVDYNAMTLEFSGVRIDMEAVYGTSLDNDMYGRTYSNMSSVLINGMSIRDFAKDLRIELEDISDEENIEHALIYILTNGITVGDIFEPTRLVRSSGQLIEDTDFEFKLKNVTPKEFSREAVKGWMLFHHACKFVEDLDSYSRNIIDVIATGFDRKMDKEKYLRCGVLTYSTEEIELKIIVKFILWSDAGFEPEELEIQVNGSVVFSVIDIDKKDSDYPGESLLEYMKHDLCYLCELSEDENKVLS